MTAKDLPDLGTDTLFALYREVAVGMDPATSPLPKTAVIEAWRTQLAADVAADKAKGLSQQIPNEWPEIRDEDFHFMPGVGSGPRRSGQGRHRRTDKSDIWGV